GRRRAGSVGQLRAARRGPGRRGAQRQGSADAERRVPVRSMLPGTPPQSARLRTQRRVDLPRVCLSPGTTADMTDPETTGRQGEANPQQPGPIVPGDQAASDATADALARLAGDDLEPAQRRQALGEVATALRKRGFGDFFKPKAALTWIADTVVDVAP